MRLIWSSAALADVQRLYRFLAAKSPEAARRAVRAIRHQVKVIALQPGVGRPSDGMDEAFREWPIDFGHSGYLALYRWDGRTAVILAVRHQRETEF